MYERTNRKKDLGHGACFRTLLFLFTLILFFPVFVSAQKKKKKIEKEDGPVNVFYPKGKAAPVFKFGKHEFDSLMFSCGNIPPFAAYLGIDANVIIYFAFDSVGEFGYVQGKSVVLNHTEPLKRFDPTGQKKILMTQEYRREGERLFALTQKMWTPVQKDGMWVDDTFQVKLHLGFEGWMWVHQLVEKHTVVDTGKIVHVIKSEEFSPERDTVKYPDIAIVFSPEIVRTHLYNKGVLKLTKKQYELAEVYFREAIIYRKKDKDAFYNLGICYFNMNSIQKACAAWKMAAKYGDKEAVGLLDKYCKN